MSDAPFKKITGVTDVKGEVFAYSMVLPAEVFELERAWAKSKIVNELRKAIIPEDEVAWHEVDEYPIYEEEESND